MGVSIRGLEIPGNCRDCKFSARTIEGPVCFWGMNLIGMCGKEKYMRHKDCPFTADKSDPGPRIGRWKHVEGDFLTPGGTPYYVCGACGESGHLHGVEYPKRKVICDNCGRINIYPHETASEESSSLWEADKE